MDKWMQLSDQQAIDWYGVPPEIARIKTNVFYGNNVPEEMMKYVWDVTRHFVGFMGNESKDYVGLRFHTVDPDSMDLIDNYNSFEISWGHYLEVDRETLGELATLLGEYAAQMVYDQNDKSISVEKLSEENLANRGIELFRLDDEKRDYILFSDYKTANHQQPTQTLICMISYDSYDILYLSAYNVPVNKIITMQNDDDYRTSIISLDRKALEMVADIFREYAAS